MNPRRRSDRKPRLAKVDELRRIAALAPLCETVLGPLSKTGHCCSYLKGDEVDLESGEGACTLLGVIEGRLQVSFRSCEGKQMPVVELREGDACDLGADGWAAPDETVITVTTPKGLVWLAPPASFHAAIGEVAAALFGRCQDWLRELGGLASGGMHPPAARIRHTLWRDARYREEDSLGYTHEHLAARSCTERSKATRVIGELRREGAIDVRRHPRGIVVLDPDQLTDE